MAKGKSLLVQGLIPKGQPCPFIQACHFRVDRCPSQEKPKEVDYSCAAARLQDMIQHP